MTVPPRTTDAQIGARLREAREAAGLSQLQAARLMELSQVQISQSELGTRSVKATELSRYSEVYFAGYDWLLGDWTENDVPDEWLKLAEKLPVPERRKLLGVLAMMGACQ